MLSTQIKTLRQGKGWSQAELARRLHISPSAIGMYEQGRREPSVDILVALSKEFDVTMDCLVAGSYGANPDYKINIAQKHFTEALIEIRNLSYDDLLILLATEILKGAELRERKNNKKESQDM